MTLNLPEHKIYKIIILGFEQSDYYAFHLLGDVWDEIDYSKQIFYKRNMMNDSNEGYLESGSFLNKEVFLQKRADFITTKSQTLFFETVVYKNEYDLMWGFSTKILINGIVKKKMEDLGFVLDFIEFKTYEIAYS